MCATITDQSSSRKDFVIDSEHVLELTESRKQYVINQIRLFGYDAKRLGDDELLCVFRLLARTEEYRTRLKHNAHNWELDYAQVERVGQSTTPLIETWLQDWVKNGHLESLANAQPVWPNGKRFALCLTHDMDVLSGNVFWDRVRSLPSYRYAPGIQRLIVAASTLRALKDRYFKMRKKADPLLLEWLDEEDRYGFKSSLFFLAQPIPEPDWEDSFYRYGDKVLYGDRKQPIGEVMKSIAARGWDVGLHGSTRSHRSAELLAKERDIVAEACGRDVTTIRQHHLLYDVRYTPLYQERAGLLADSTMGSNIRSCYRNGTGMPYYQYDLFSDRELNVLQAPLIIQDVALFRVLKMDEETAFNHCMQLITRVAELGGMITLLWHNNYDAANIEYKVYCRLLEEAAPMGAWGCSLRQVQQHWEERRTRLL